jgi:hypothetical protein
MAMVERRCMVGGVKGEGGDGPCMAANGRLGVVEKNLPELVHSFLSEIQKHR